jgi:hypothetical protein
MHEPIELSKIKPGNLVCLVAFGMQVHAHRLRASLAWPVRLDRCAAHSLDIAQHMEPGYDPILGSPIP